MKNTMEIDIIIIRNIFVPDTGGLYSTVEDLSDEIILSHFYFEVYY